MAAAPQKPERSSVLGEARILAVVPLANTALRVPELLTEQMYREAIAETLVSVAICLLIAGAYRAANWIMSDHQNDDTHTIDESLSA